MCRTEGLEHLVAFVEDKVLDVVEFEAFVASQGEDPARRSHHDVRTVLLQRVLILLDRHPAEEYAEKGRRRIG